MDANLMELANQAIESVKPSLVAAGGKLATDVIAKAGEGAGRLYAWLKAKLTRPVAAAALKEATERPEDEESWEDLRAQIAKLVEQNADMRSELAELLGKQAGASITTMNMKQDGDGNTGVQIKGKGNSVSIGGA